MFSTQYVEGIATGEPGIRINPANDEMDVSYNVLQAYNDQIIPLKNFQLIMLVANGGDLDNSSAYGAVSGNNSFIGTGVNPDNIQIIVSSTTTDFINIYSAAPINDSSVATEYTDPTKAYVTAIEVKVPSTITSNTNTVLAYEASILKFLRANAPESIIRVITPITWNENGSTNVSSSK